MPPFFPILADLALVFCDKPEKAKLLLDNIEKGEISVLKTIVIMDPFESDLATRGKKCGVDVISMKEFEVSEVVYGTATSFDDTSKSREERSKV